MPVKTSWGFFSLLLAKNNIQKLTCLFPQIKLQIASSNSKNIFIFLNISIYLQEIIIPGRNTSAFIMPLENNCQKFFNNI